VDLLGLCLALVCDMLMCGDVCRTRMILFKMLNQGLVGEIHGCVSTGKEVFATRP
jgi:hypothetical protein